jgi:hypothetical protein
MTPEDAVSAGLLVALPADYVVDHPDGRRVAYLAGHPLDLGDDSGDDDLRHLEPGDLIAASEIVAARDGLRRLVRTGAIVEVEAARGVVGAVWALFARVERLERALVLSSMSDEELRQLAILRKDHSR